MAWDGPILTDSGGFQVFSLAQLNRINDDGVVFKSHIDGSSWELTPQRSIGVQNALGADIIMAFDQCPPADASPEEHAQAVARTLRWARISRDCHARPEEQSLFGIVQGGVDPELRRHCAEKLAALDLPGYAQGGLAVGEGFEAMRDILQKTTPLLPRQKPRYLMGVGYPRDIVMAVACGVDMFDCVLPTRNGRNASAFTAGGSIRLRNRQFSRDSSPIEADCDCYACRHFTRAALRHYFFAGEMLGPILVSVHNIRFYQRLMADLRQALAEGRFARFCLNEPRCRIRPTGNV
jgi:queuine tRNA-ribosyltransferase